MYCIFLSVGWYRSGIELTNVNVVADFLKHQQAIICVVVLYMYCAVYVDIHECVLLLSKRIRMQHGI